MQQHLSAIDAQQQFRTTLNCVEMACSKKDLRPRRKIENRWNQRITSAFLKASQATPRPRLRLGAAGFAPENLH
ncbi:hypothetical protein [Agrobacterium sp. CG674]